MQIDEAIGKTVDEDRRQNLHPAGADDQVGLKGGDLVCQILVVSLARASAVAVRFQRLIEGRNPRLLRAHQAIGAAAIGNHRDHLRGQAALLTGSQQGLQIAPAA